MPTASDRPSFIMIPEHILLRTDLNASAKLVYAVIADAVRRGLPENTSLLHVRTVLGLRTDRPVWKGIRKLVECGLLIKDSRSRPGHTQASAFRLPETTGQKTAVNGDVERDHGPKDRGTTGQRPVGPRAESTWNHGPEDRTIHSRVQTEQKEPAVAAEATQEAPGPDTDAVLETLRSHRIESPTDRIILDDLPGLTSAMVNTVLEPLNGRAPPGVCVNTLREQAPSLIRTAADDAEAVGPARERLALEEAKLVQAYEADEQAIVEAIPDIRAVGLDSERQVALKSFVDRIGGNRAAAWDVVTEWRTNPTPRAERAIAALMFEVSDCPDVTVFGQREPISRCRADGQAQEA